MLLQPRYMGRFRQVAAVFVRHGFSDVLEELDLRRFLPGKERTPTESIDRAHNRAHHLRVALEELGPTYIKLGQLLSTRPDILPVAYLVELEALQDRVEPFPFEPVRQTLETELHRPLDEIFAELAREPVASASLAQVHRARLRPEVARNWPTREVAIKVLRPRVEQTVELDLGLLTELAELAGRSAIGVRYDVVGLVGQLRRALTGELSLREEARNLHHFHDALADFPLVLVPRVVDELTTNRILTMEYMAGQRIAEVSDQGPRPQLARELWRAYLKQVLGDGLFHCDPHPGNFLLDDEGRIVLLDFGMVAHLSRQTQIQLLALLLSLADRDGDGAADACVEIGIPGPSFDERGFRTEIALMVARYSGRPLAELALGSIVMELLRTGARHQIRVPAELMLFGKTLLNLETLSRRLDPAVDPVAATREMAGAVLARQLGRDFSRQKALAATLTARSLLAEVPTNLRRLLRRAAGNDLRIGIRLEGEKELHAAIQKIASRITLGLITAALIIGSALLLNVEAGLTLWGYPLFALIGFLLAAGLGIYLVLKIILLDRG